MLKYLISVPTHKQFLAVQKELLEASKISKPEETKFITQHIPHRKQQLKGLRGFKPSQLIGQFSNDELFDLQLSADSCEVVEEIVDLLVYSGVRRRHTTKNVQQLMRFENHAKTRLEQEARKHGQDIAIILNDVDVRVAATPWDEEE